MPTWKTYRHLDVAAAVAAVAAPVAVDNDFLSKAHY
jgi:hypothetical protein